MMLSGLVLLQIAADPNKNDFLPEQMSTTIVQRFRMSAEIDRGNALLHVSKADPDFAAALIDEYEKGMRRIEASGERSRIFGYYGFEPVPVADAEEGTAR